MSSCLDDETVALFADGTLSGQRRIEAQAHLDRCGSCRDLVSHVLPETRVDSFVPRRDDDDDVPGARIGRYVVERQIGRGGMGVVLLAHDPELDRAVAIKVLRPERRTDDEERLVREARSMARLVHPNVLTIHDVGTSRGRVYLAMEYVAGTTLRGWLAAKPRTVEEIIDRFTKAGRGLAAAHAAGIVHRDFKPDNVLIGNDARVRVGDFGLAHASRAHATPSASDDSAPVSFGDGLTRTGSVMGTPAYMAPEQHDAGRATPRTDQFAFAVALWEALYRARPFAGKNAAEIAENARAGVIVPPPSGVDRRIDRALRRALAVDPEARFPGMDALLVAIAPRPPRWRVALSAAAVFVAAGVGVAVAWPRLHPKPVTVAPACVGIDQEITRVWNGGERADLRKALVSSDVPLPSVATRDAAADRVLSNLDAYAASWTAETKDACEATNVRHTQTDAMFGARSACLARRRDEMRSLVTALKKGDLSTIDRAVVASAQLTPISACGDTAALLAGGPSPPAPAIAADVERIRGALSDAKALAAAGRSYDAAKATEAATNEARALGYRPLLAESLLALGRLSFDDEAKKALLEAVWMAEASHDDVVAAKAWVALLEFETTTRDFTDVEDWSTRASASIERLEGQRVIKASLLGALASVRYNVGQPVEARDLAARAIQTRASSAGAETLEDANDLEVRALAEIALDFRLEAEADLTSHLAIVERILGPEYDETYHASLLLGRLEGERGAWDAALARFTHAERLANAKLARVHDVASRISKDESATFDQILKAETPAFEVHHFLADIAIARGAVLEARGDLDAAEAAFRAGQIIAENHFGAKSKTAVPALVALAELALRRHRDGFAFASDAYAAAKKHMAPHDLDRVAAVVALAGAKRARGDASGARALLAEIPVASPLPARLAARLAIVKRELDPTSDADPTPFLAKAGRLADPERARAKK